MFLIPIQTLKNNLQEIFFPIGGDRIIEIRGTDLTLCLHRICHCLH